jgi:hypothetical protein
MSGVFRNIDPPPPPPNRPASVYTPAFGAGGVHTRWVERGGGVYSSKDDRHCSVLYICKYFVVPGLLSSRPHWAPTPSPARECCSPFGSKGGDTLTFRGGGGGEPIPIHSGTLKLVYFNLWTTDAVKYSIIFPHLRPAYRSFTDLSGI